MFTSRAEYRLALRADNADQRLTLRGIEVGVVGEKRASMFHVKHRALESARTRLKTLNLSPAAAVKNGWTVNQDGRVRSAWEYLSYKEITFAHLVGVWPELSDVPADIVSQIEIEALYSAYLDRQADDVAALRRDEALSIPPDLDFDLIGGLSNEVRQKLKAVRPGTLGQAARIEGVTPGALTALLGHVRRIRKAG